MKEIKRVFLGLFVVVMLVGLLFPSNVDAKSNRIDEIISEMSNEDKIAMMIMPSFRSNSTHPINEDNIKDIIGTYEFAGVILFAENTADIESTMRFVDLLQTANKDHNSRLLIAIDQEGGYVTRLGIGTSMPGNMALSASNDPENAYKAAKVIGKELKTLGINTNFAPVVDVNSNPANPVIGVRSFSDDPNIVATYGERFMSGLQSEGIITSLKHFPGHGDTATDTHTGLEIINKTYDELKSNELIPFQSLINSGTDMIMTAHIQYPNIEKETYVSKKDNQTYTLPATLSKTILTDIVRGDMNYEGVIITDALDMAAIADNFDLLDASVKAINAGVDILLMPYTYDSSKEELKAYIKTLASKVGNEISEENVNNSVRRILTLKEKKGLLEAYDNTNLETDIVNAKNVVSSKDSHEEEFDLAKKAVTMIKNEDDVLPLSSEDRTVILYEYNSHIQAVSNAVSMLKKENDKFNGDNIKVYPFYNADLQLPLDEVKKQVLGAKNVIMIHSLYGTSGMSDPDIDKMNQLIDFIHGNNGKVIVMSTQLPYDVVKYPNADAIILTYLANGIRIDLNDYEKEIPKYGANVMAGIYMLFTNKENVNGVLPVNIYNIDQDSKYTDEVYYPRGLGLKYSLKEEKERYTVSFETNGGTAVLDQRVEKGSLVVVPEETTKASYSFVGWYVDSEFKEAFDFRTPITDNIKLYAKWKYINHMKVTTEGMGSIAYTSPDGGLEYDGGTFIYTILKGTYIVGAKADEGYQFVKWTKNGEDYLNDEEITISLEDDDIELVAIFEVEEKNMKEYIVESVLNDGNSISFIDEENKTFQFDIRDRLSLTDDDLQKLVDELNDEDYTFEILKARLDQLIQYGKLAAGNDTLLKLYEMYITENGIEIHEADGGFKIKLKITDDMRGYDSYKIVYIAEDGTIEDAIKLTVNGDYLEGVLPHLSFYALIGSVDEPMKSPDTGDSILIYIIMLGLSLIALIGTGIIFKNLKLR